MGLKFTQAQPVKNTENTSASDFMNRDIALFGSSFSNKKKEFFYRELSILLKSGVTLKAALEIICESQEKKKDKARYEQILQEVLEGKLLSEAIASQKGFTIYEKHALQIADTTGQKEEITNDLYEFYKNKNKQRRQITSSLTYPVIVLLTAFGVTFFMLKYVVPTFEDTFNQNGVELPGLTKAIMSASNFVADNGGLLFIVLAAIIVGYLLAKKQFWYKKFMGNLLVKLPLIGKFIKRTYIVQFTHAMALLTKAKVPMVTSLGLVKDMIDFYPLQQSLSEIEVKIVQGERLYTTFGNSTFFEKKMIALLKVAEETNQTEYIFNKLYEQYRDDLVYQSGQLTTVLNPLLTIFVGLIVGIILLAMYLPMFQLSSLIG